MSFDSRYAQKLEGVLIADLNQAHVNLGNGGQLIREDAAATGMNCAKYIGLIEGLNLARQRMEEVHDEMMGKTKPEKKA